MNPVRSSIFKRFSRPSSSLTNTMRTSCEQSFENDPNGHDGASLHDQATQLLFVNRLRGGVRSDVDRCLKGERSVVRGV